MDVHPFFSILDQRTDFVGRTYSDYKKTDVITELAKSIIENNTEYAIYWAVELHISGHLNDIWQIIIEIMSKYLDNPHLPSWLYTNYKKFNKLLSEYNKTFILESRNNQEMRNLIADIIATTSLSNKTNYNIPKIKKDAFTEESIIKNMTFNHSVTPDSKIAYYEITQNLHNPQKSVYWFLWLKKFIKMQKQNGIHSHESEDHIIWEIIDKNRETNALRSFYQELHLTSQRKNMLIIKALNCQQLNWNQPIINKYYIRVMICANINEIYRAKRYDTAGSINIGQRDEDIIKKYKEKQEKIKPNIQINTSMNKNKELKIHIDNKKQKQFAKINNKLKYLDDIVIYKKI